MNRLMTVAAAVLTLLILGGLAYAIYSGPDAVFSGEQPAAREPLKPSNPEPILLTVEAGGNPKTIGEMLHGEGVIASARHFEVLVGLLGVADTLEAGEYEFERGIPALEAVTRIAEGRTASRSVVIPEGLRAEEIGEILERGNIVTKDAFMSALVRSQYAHHPFLAQVTSESLEGFLFPAAYEFRRNTTAAEVVDTLLLGFQTNVADKIQLEGQPYTLEEVVALAAIVEREATVTGEHPIIASVFLNRLRDSIPLQADPTVQFALSSDAANVAQYGWWKEELTLEDLEFDSPYNTYVHAGLTPGPIANPGLDTIQSVVRPAETSYLYFVARGDGTHAFAETLEEHLANIEQYQ